MRFFFCFLFFLNSCQADYFSQMFNQWKDYSLTQLASQTTKEVLPEKDKKKLIYLYQDLSRANNCEEVQSLIEENQILVFFESNMGLNRGFLFDALLNYNYEKSLFMNRNKEQQVAFSIVSVWKTKFSLDQINSLIKKINKCYPDEYVALLKKSCSILT